MMNSTRWGLIGLSCLLCFCTESIGQDTRTLESKRKVIENQIELTNQILSKTQKNKSSTQNDFLAIKSQIDNREALIDNIKSELDSTEISISTNEDRISQLENKLLTIEEKYNQVLKGAYRQKLTQNTWLYLLSSKSLREALLRWRYTQQFQRYCNEQIYHMHTTKTILKEAITNIQNEQEVKESLLQKESNQKDLLSSELDQKNKLIKSLEKNEKTLLAELKKKTQEANKLQQSIQQIISGYVSTTDHSTVNKNEVEKINNTVPKNNSPSFAMEKGKLIWPVNEGIIVRPFGKQKHPTLPNIEIENNGIDIRTPKSENVKAIFDGTVAGINFIPGNYNVVVIRHGDYLSVYSRLERLNVKKGDKISKGQSIGQIVNEGGVYIMHLEIWNDTKKENPIPWLIK